ncbi:MAG: hypothetical protein FP816_02390 [Desulfobacteraceae bacterium]|nr:hypothetical protein [Desulfobacteraceae bacterium]MBU4055736.1 putative DNA binding domain-containing protein [Pseudomonadota bacterium]
MKTSAVKNLIALGEGFTTEFKRSGTSGLGREICAFANTTGGVILIGVTDTGQVVGVKEHNRLKSEIQAIARSAEPPIAVEVSSAGGILCVTVPEQHIKPYSFGGKFFMREGATSQQMSRNEIRQFFFKEGLIHFDETTCTAYDLGKDLTPTIWKRFVKRANIPDKMDMVTALKNLHLAKDGNMTLAGAWLLCDDITRYTLRAGVTCALFRGTTNVHILDRKDFTGDLYTIYEDCMTYMQSKLNTALVPHARGRDERLELPEDSLREALVNAIAHRDYRSTANVQVHIYSERLEIITPGGLPAGMKKEDMGKKSVPRNPLLFGLFYRMNLVEQIGSGVKRIRDLCRDYGVAEPLFEISEDWVTLSFPRPGEKGSEKERMEKAQAEAHEEAQVGVKSGRGIDSTGEVTPEVAPEVTPEVRLMLLVLKREMTRREIMHAMGLSDEKHFREHYQQTAIRLGLMEMTIPEKPSSRLQKYRLTSKGRNFIEKSGEIP